MAAAEPWSKWFWTDYEADPGLRMSSLAAQGLWMRMLCLMAKATPKGELRVGSEPCTVADLAVYVGQPEETVAALIEELRRRGVFSTTRAGVIYNRRLRNDAIISRKRAEAGAKGAAATNGKYKDNSDLPRQNSGKPSGKSPAPEARSQKLEDSVPNGTGASPPNLRERLWTDGLMFVIASGQPEAKARGLLGKWRKAAIEKLGKADGEAKVISLLAEAQRDTVSDLVPWMEVALKSFGSSPVLPFKRETQQEREARERAEWVERNYGPNSPRAKAKGGER